MGDRGLLAVVLSVCVVVAGCNKGDRNPASGCTSDVQCKGSRICVGGECVDPGRSPAAPEPNRTQTASPVTAHPSPPAPPAAASFVGDWAGQLVSQGGAGAAKFDKWYVRIDRPNSTSEPSVNVGGKNVLLIGEPDPNGDVPVMRGGVHATWVEGFREEVDRLRFDARLLDESKLSFDLRTRGNKLVGSATDTAGSRYSVELDRK